MEVSDSAPLPIGGCRLETPVSRCRGCDLFVRDVDPAVQRARAEAAGYTAPSNRETLCVRREGFFRWVLDLVTGPLGGGASSLLDVGASYGHLLRLARDRGLRVAGVEIVERLREEIERDLGVPCWARLQDVEGRFDAVTFLDSFYYFDDPHAALEEVNRVLADRGLIVFRVTNRNALVRALRVAWPPRRFDPLGDVVISWSLRGLRRLLAAHGFRVGMLRFREPGWTRPPATRLAVVALAGMSHLTSRWDSVLTPGLTVAAMRERER